MAGAHLRDNPPPGNCSLGRIAP